MPSLFKRCSTAEMANQVMKFLKVEAGTPEDRLVEVLEVHPDQRPPGAQRMEARSSEAGCP